MGDVWDRTMEVVSGRGRILTTIAVLLLWLPGVIRTAMAVWLTGAASPALTPATAGASGSFGLLFVVALIAAGLGVIGQLALIAVASDPATTQAEAMRTGVRRFGPTIGITMLLSLAAFVLLIPMALPFVAAFAHVASMTPDAMAGAVGGIGAGSRAFVGLYAVALFCVGIWVVARLALLNAVIVNERLGVRSIARAFALTRGLAARIVGVMILAGIVVAVVMLAVQSVGGIAFRLILGSANMALADLMTVAATGVIGTALTVLWCCFIAQLYVAVHTVRAAPIA